MIERLIEVSFPYKEVSELAKKERRSPRAYQLAHPWPGRRPGVAFRSLILASILSPEHEVEFWRLLKREGKANVGKGKVFLDPFAGSGTSLLEALSLGMQAIGVDINVVAFFITKTLLAPVNIEALHRVSRKVFSKLEKECRWLYETVTPDGEVISAKAFFWVKTLTCLYCKSKISLFKTYKLAKLHDKVWVYCPECEFTSLVRDEPNPRCGHCGSRLEPVVRGRYYKCTACGQLGRLTEAVSATGKPGMELFAVMYKLNNSLIVKAANEFDLEKYRKAELLAQCVPKDFMDLEIRMGEETRRILRYGYRNYRELFNARQYFILFRILIEVMKQSERYRDPLLLAISKTATFLNILTPYSYVERKPESMYALHQLMHEQMYMEINPFERIRGSFLNSLKNIMKAKSYIRRQLGSIRISTSVHDLGSCDAIVLLGSASRLELPAESVDLVVTDPPHFGNVVNSGLADFHYSILKYALGSTYREFKSSRSCDEAEEVVLDNARGWGIDDYRAKLSRIFNEVNRVLKSDGLFVVMFRHSLKLAWDILYASIEDAKFDVVKEWPIECEIELQPQVKRSKQKPKEAVIVCRKSS